MTFARLPLLAALALVALVGLTPQPLRAEPPLFSDQQRGAIEQIVRDYLVSHPDVLVEAMSALREKQEAEQAKARQAALTTNRDQLLKDPATPVGGNAEGDVTLIEFFDYQCGYCKAVFQDLQKLLKDDPKLRFVYKELPILSPASRLAAQAALASQAQGKYVAFHNALMSHRGQLSEEVIFRLAGSAGLDLERLRQDMADPRIERQLNANQELAEALEIRGTPGFVLGSQVIPGVLDLGALKKMIADERKRS